MSMYKFCICYVEETKQRGGLARDFQHHHQHASDTHTRKSYRRKIYTYMYVLRTTNQRIYAYIGTEMEQGRKQTDTGTAGLG